MNEINIDAEKARQIVKSSAAGIEEARELITREIEASARGMRDSHHGIPVNKRQITLAQAEQLSKELRDRGFTVGLTEQDIFFIFSVSWV